MKKYKRKFKLNNIKSNEERQFILYKPKKFINQIIKKDIMIYSIMILSLIFLGSTSTYAFLSTEVNTVELENVVSADIEGISLKNSSINISNIIPSTETEIINSFSNENKCKSSNNTICTLYEFNIKNDGNTSRNLTYSFDNVVNTFSNLKFKVFSGQKESLNSSSVSLMTSEILKRNVTNILLTGLPSNIKTNETLNFTIVFWIEKTENDQTIMDASKIFSANLLVDLKSTGYEG